MQCNNVVLLYLPTVSKYIDSNHLCYIYLASFTSPANLFPESWYLVPLILPSKLVQKTCTKYFHYSGARYSIPYCTLLLFSHIIKFRRKAFEEGVVKYSWNNVQSFYPEMENFTLKKELYLSDHNTLTLHITLALWFYS